MSEKLDLVIWNRAFSLKVLFDCFDDEEVLDSQRTALKYFKEADISASLDQVKQFCLEQNGKEIGTTIDNIFKYVVPYSVYIPRKQKESTAALLCHYRFDIENDLALIFENGNLVKICNPDYIL